MEISQKPQIIIIGGGESHKTEQDYLTRLASLDLDTSDSRADWKKWLTDGLASDFEVFRISMPDKMHALFPAWKIWFEKYFPRIAHMPKDGEEKSTIDRINEKKVLPQIPLILVGHSLGATFLIKYLTEYGFPRDIQAVHLIAPALSDAGLISESLASFAPSLPLLPHLHKQAHQVHIWASTDDAIVPYEHSVHAHVNIVGSVLHTFHHAGHFDAQSHFIDLFTEILKSIPSNK